MTPCALWLALAAAQTPAPPEAAEAVEVDPPARVTVSVARLPLPAGKKLTWDDLTTVDVPAALVPPTAVVKGTELVGKVLAHPVAQQSAIVGQRLEGWVPPPVPEAEAADREEVPWNLGPMGALVQAGDTVVWAKLRDGCRLATGVVLRRGAETVFDMPTDEAETLRGATDPALLLKGPGAQAGRLPACGEASGVVIQGAP